MITTLSLHSVASSPFPQVKGRLLRGKRAFTPWLGPLNFTSALLLSRFGPAGISVSRALWRLRSGMVCYKAYWLRS